MALAALLVALSMALPSPGDGHPEGILAAARARLKVAHEASSQAQPTSEDPSDAQALVAAARNRAMQSAPSPAVAPKAAADAILASARGRIQSPAAAEDGSKLSGAAELILSTAHKNIHAVPEATLAAARQNLEHRTFEATEAAAEKVQEMAGASRENLQAVPRAILNHAHENILERPRAILDAAREKLLATEEASLAAESTSSTLSGVVALCEACSTAFPNGLPSSGSLPANKKVTLLASADALDSQVNGADSVSVAAYTAAVRALEDSYQDLQGTKTEFDTLKQTVCWDSVDVHEPCSVILDSPALRFDDVKQMLLQMKAKSIQASLEKTYFAGNETVVEGLSVAFPVEQAEQVASNLLESACVTLQHLPSSICATNS